MESNETEARRLIVRVSLGKTGNDFSRTHSSLLPVRARCAHRWAGHEYRDDTGAMALIYKIVPGELWRDTQQKGVFHGSDVDRRDGFIHFSTAEQVAETAAKHFSGQDGLLLFAVETESLGTALKWEISRNGAPFPHLYAPLSVALILWARPLPRSSAWPDCPHVLPELG